jgi:hypothetical protein
VESPSEANFLLPSSAPADKVKFKADVKHESSVEAEVEEKDRSPTATAATQAKPQAQLQPQPRHRPRGATDPGIRRKSTFLFGWRTKEKGTTVSEARVASASAGDDNVKVTRQASKAFSGLRSVVGTLSRRNKARTGAVAGAQVPVRGRVKALEPVTAVEKVRPVGVNQRGGGEVIGKVRPVDVNGEVNDKVRPVGVSGSGGGEVSVKLGLDGSTGQGGGGVGKHMRTESGESAGSAGSEGTGVGAGVRLGIKPTMHSRGTIQRSAAGIKDDESRRLCEMAFLT